MTDGAAAATTGQVVATAPSLFCGGGGVNNRRVSAGQRADERFWQRLKQGHPPALEPWAVRWRGEGRSTWCHVVGG